jgi:hypothetical protein
LKDENEAYANMIVEELNEFLQHSSYRLSAAIYDISEKDPLNMVALSFGINKKNIITLKSADDFADTLKMLNKRLLRKKRQNIYVIKQYTYYDNNTIYIVKPNQKRLWTRSQAMNDATVLTVEIANMKK